MNRKPEKTETEDRLSSLPDELLHHIFSFVDSFYIIQASFLSRRYTLLFSSAPTLSFSYAKYCNRFLKTRFDWQPGLEDRFTSFIYTCLSLRDRRFPVREMVFDACEGRVKADAVKALVAKAAELQVQRLSLTAEWLKFPASLCNSRSLKELTLRSQYMKLLDDIAFPTLTKLHLEGIRLYDTKFNNLVSRCPNLETLILAECTIVDEKTLQITAPKLINLVISSSYDIWGIPKDFEFIINAPRLARFQYRRIKAMNFSLVGSGRLLDEVDIDVFEGKDELFEGGLNSVDKTDKINGLIRMVDVFKLAKTIKLSRSTIKCLSEAAGLVEMESCCNGRLRDFFKGPTVSSYDEFKIALISKFTLNTSV